MSLHKHILFVAILTTGGCIGESPENGATGPSAGPDDRLIGGTPADSAALNAVGALGFDANGTGTYQLRCSAILIAPSVILTANHCLRNVAVDRLAFLIGPDAAAPIQVIPARSGVAETPVPGLGGGADIAVVHLTQEVTGIVPMPVQALTEDRVGDRFTAFGYGIQDAAGTTSGTRRSGPMTFLGLQGKIMELIYGSFDTFLAEGVPFLYPNHNPSIPSHLNDLHRLYDTDLLKAGLEAAFGARPGDAQICNFDSGGPITAEVNGTTTVFGLGQFMYRTKRGCDIVSAYAAINPATLDLIARETAAP